MIFNKNNFSILSPAIMGICNVTRDLRVVFAGMFGEIWGRHVIRWFVEEIGRASCRERV